MTARLKCETRAKCQELVALFQEDGILCESESPFCYAVKTFSVFQSKSLEERVIGQQFAPLWPDQLKLLFFFFARDDERAFREFVFHLCENDYRFDVAKRASASIKTTRLEKSTRSVMSDSRHSFHQFSLTFRGCCSTGAWTTITVI